MRKEIVKKTILYSLKQSLPVMAGYLVLGIGFGLLLYDAGYSFLWAGFMSLTIYAGSLQFVGVDLITAGAGILTTAMTTVFVNARHVFYGISMLEKYRNTGKKKPYLIFALTDETYSLVCNANPPEGVDLQLYYLILSIFNQSYWVIGSMLGGLIGRVLPFPTEGVEFSMTALFVVVFLGQWEQTGNHLPALSGLAISVVCLLLFGVSSFLIPSMILITICLFLFRPWMEGKKEVLKEGE